jgi:hypothetical protein
MPEFEYHYYRKLKDKIAEVKIVCDKYSIEAYGFYYDSLLARISFPKANLAAQRPLSFKRLAGNYLKSKTLMIPLTSDRFINGEEYFNLLGRNLSCININMQIGKTPIIRIIGEENARDKTKR